MRHEKDVIDWVGEGTIESPYIAENIAEVDTDGVEVALLKESLYFIKNPQLTL